MQPRRGSSRTTRRTRSSSPTTSSRRASPYGHDYGDEGLSRFYSLKGTFRGPTWRPSTSRTSLGTAVAAAGWNTLPSPVGRLPPPGCADHARDLLRRPALSRLAALAARARCSARREPSRDPGRLVRHRRCARSSCSCWRSPSRAAPASRPAPLRSQPRSSSSSSRSSPFRSSRSSSSCTPVAASRTAPRAPSRWLRARASLHSSRSTPGPSGPTRSPTGRRRTRSSATASPPCFSAQEFSKDAPRRIHSSWSRSLVWLPATFLLLRAQWRSREAWLAPAGFASRSSSSSSSAARSMRRTWIWPLAGILMAVLLAVARAPSPRCRRRCRRGSSGGRSLAAAADARSAEELEAGRSDDGPGVVGNAEPTRGRAEPRLQFAFGGILQARPWRGSNQEAGNAAPGTKGEPKCFRGRAPR